MSKVQFTITFRALPHPAPATVRLRRLLKLALRSLAFRCMSVEAGPDAGEGAKHSPALQPAASTGKGGAGHE
jgi:hypothetical protein